MTVEIVNVKRVDGKAEEVSAFVGDIEITFRYIGQDRYIGRRLFKEVSRIKKYGSRSLYIPSQDYKNLYRKVYAIFNEERKTSKKEAMGAEQYKG